MSGFLCSALINEWRTFFPRWTYALQVLVTSVFTVSIYYFTSKALSANLDKNINWYGLTYFEFLMIGELGLMLHLSALEGFSRALRFSHMSGFLDDLLARDHEIYPRFSELGLALQLRDFIQWLGLLFVAIAFFGLRVNATKLAQAAILGLISWPAFFFLGQVLGSVILVTGRGMGVVGQFLFLLAVLSGAYFPTDVFPLWFRDNLVEHIPTTQLLHNLRLILSVGVTGGEYLGDLIYFAILGIVLYFVARLTVALSVRRRRIRADRWIMPLR